MLWFRHKKTVGQHVFVQHKLAGNRPQVSLKISSSGMFSNIPMLWPLVENDTVVSDLLMLKQSLELWSLAWQPFRL